jgi:hypothetical protein
LRLRSVVAMAIALVLVVGAGVAAGAELPPGGSFTDDNGNIHEANIEAVRAADITTGCNPPTSDKYCPDDPVTRGQMAAFLHRALDEILMPSQPPTPFVDAEDSLFASDIAWLSATGVTKGCNPPDNDQFCPDGKVTREQMAAFLARALDLPTTSTDYFTDDDESIFEDDINRLAAVGITKGCSPPPGTAFCPVDRVLRDQMASFLARALGLDPIVPPPPPPPPPEPEVFAIGDSVMLGVGCTPDRNTCYGGSWNLENRIPKLRSDAAVSRSFASGDNVLAGWLARGNDPDVVVVHLGTNGGGSTSRFDDIMDAAGPGRRVLFVTIKQNNTSNETAMNNLLKARVPMYDNAELVDWYAASTANLNMDAIDGSYGAHLWSTSARALYVTLIDDAIASP